MMHHPPLLIALALPNLLSHAQYVQFVSRCDRHASSVRGPLESIQALARRCRVTPTGDIAVDGYALCAADGFIEGGGEVPNVEGAVAGGGGEDGGMDGTPLHITHVIIRIAQKTHQWPIVRICRCPKLGRPIHSRGHHETSRSSHKSLGHAPHCGCGFLVARARRLKLRHGGSCGHGGDHSVMSHFGQFLSVGIFLHGTTGFRPHDTTRMQCSNHPFRRTASAIPTRPSQNGMQPPPLITTNHTFLITTPMQCLQTAQIRIHLHMFHRLT
mmetsp:Transcript_8626/g.15656  ORF Transcript_8626/g.15656 Transcript_8626/m.15656 type:complete len:270 (+) Transcript_8626:234-1043(+)